MIASIPEHWNPNGSGFYCPDPDKEGAFIPVYIESYERDDSDAAAKKRHIVTIEIIQNA